MVQRSQASLASVSFAVLCGLCAAVQAATSLAAADAAWADRGDRFVSAPAAAGTVGQAIAAYEAVLETEPGNLEAMWKLLRALEFRGEYTQVSPQERRRLYGESIEWVERALAVLHSGRDVKGRAPEELAREVEGRPHAATVHYWAALHWGLFGETHGAMAAIKKGVAKRIRLHAETAILLDPAAEWGGGFRVLGRMHGLAPRVPLFTGWIDRDEAVRLLEEAHAVAPDNPFNRVFLADTWLTFRPEREREAVALLESVVAEEPPHDPQARVENAEALRQARELLSSLRMCK